MEQLLITDIPETVEAELNMTAMRDSFATQLQILQEIRDQVLHLQTLGHFDFQVYLQQFAFEPFETVKGIDRLMDERERLLSETRSWDSLVAGVRAKYYFLNYFTMRDILQIADVLQRAQDTSHMVTGQCWPFIFVFIHLSSVFSC